MKKTLEIERRASAESKPYLQSFVFETDDERATVASALRELGARPDLCDATGASATPVRWECGCLQRRCGACAMLVDGRPCLACDTRLADLRGGCVHLAPLRKFPVVADLVVDRQALFDRLRALGAWLDGTAELAVRRHDAAFEAARCLQCGICLEVCPNFQPGGDFAGMAGQSDLARLLAVAPREDRARLARAYREGVHAGCGKSLACRNVCPAGLDLGRLMSRSNAAAIWHRW